MRYPLYIKPSRLSFPLITAFLTGSSSRIFIVRIKESITHPHDADSSNPSYPQLQSTPYPDPTSHVPVHAHNHYNQPIISNAHIKKRCDGNLQNLIHLLNRKPLGFRQQEIRPDGSHKHKRSKKEPCSVSKGAEDVWESFCDCELRCPVAELVRRTEWDCERREKWDYH